MIIYEHDGDTKVDAKETNQKLENVIDEIITKLYDTLQKYKQG